MSDNTKELTPPPVPAKEPNMAPETGVVFDQNQNQSGSIPEEYLTDEDLYPAQSTNGANLGSTIKKKTPLIAIIVIGLFVFIVLLVMLVRLFNKTGSSQEPLKLTFWGVYQAENNIAELIKAYKVKQPNVEIEYTLMDAKDNYRERIIERTKNGTGPDIFRFHNTWVSSLRDLFAPSPQTIMTVEDFTTIYYPVIVKDLVLENQVIGFPYNLDGLVLVYNENLLKSAGVSAPPSDWEELIDVSRKVTVKDDGGSIITAGIALGGAESINHFSDILGMMFLQNNVDLKSLEGNANAETVLITYTDFILSTTNVWEEDLGDSLNAFAEEKVAMIFVPTWEVEVLRQLNPDLPLKVASVPQIRGGNKKNIANYWADGVSRGSKYQAEAWNFLKFLSEKENQAKLHELEVKSGRIFGNIYPRMDMADLLLDNEYLSPLVKDANILDSLPLVSRTYDHGLNDEFVDGYLKDAINTILLNNSSQEAMYRLVEGAKDVFPRYNY
jgi:multiple sugar transport system substrate-binding protein